MTRGKHAASAAKRRAEAAYEELDRLHPQLVDAKRLAARYKSEAESAVALRAKLAELRDVVGVPRAEHDRIVEELEAKHTAAMDRRMAALALIIDRLGDLRCLQPTHKEEWINAEFVKALQQLPRELACDLLGWIGVEREFARSLHRKTWMPERLSEGVMAEAKGMAAIAAEAGYPAGRIPRSMIHPVTLDQVLDGTSVVRPENVAEPERSEADG
jgi:hypothetical protein